jgi:hypothetical protein
VVHREKVARQVMWLGNRLWPLVVSKTSGHRSRTSTGPSQHYPSVLIPGWGCMSSAIRARLFRTQRCVLSILGVLCLKLLSWCLSQARPSLRGGVSTVRDFQCNCVFLRSWKLARWFFDRCYISLWRRDETGDLMNFFYQSGRCRLERLLLPQRDRVHHVP